VETPDLFDFDDPETEEAAPAQPPTTTRPPLTQLRPTGGIWSAGQRVAWVAGLVLLLSSFMSWYSGSSVEGPTLSVIGWHTGTIGKVVLFLGLAAVLLFVLREVGVSMPATVPESLVTIGIGSVATILVLVRIISIPDSFFFASRGLGIWISLVCSIGIILAGLLEASEEL
jgi:hypothetical protein